MPTVDDPFPAALAKRMIRDDLAGVANDDPAGAHHNLDALADQAPGDRIAVGVEIDGAVGLNPAGEVAQLAKRRPAAKRPQRASFALEPLDRRFARRAVDADVRHLSNRRPATALRFT